MIMMTMMTIYLYNYQNQQSSKMVFVQIITKFLIKTRAKNQSLFFSSNKSNDSSLSLICSSKHRQCQSSGSLPPFYRGIFESDDDKEKHLDYRLPYDIFWFGQKRKEKETESTIEVFPISPVIPDHSFSASPISYVEITTKKKKASQPKQKKPVPYKKIQRNQYTEQLQQKLLTAPNAEKSSSCNCKISDTCDDGICLNRMSFTECSANCSCG